MRRRKQQGLSRRALAGLVGRSEEWLRQIEIGHRRLDSLSVALQLVDVLGLDRIDDILDLGERTPASGGPATSSVVKHIRIELALPDSLQAHTVRADPVGADRRYDQLATDLAELCHTWWHASSRIPTLSAGLPRLISAARRQPRTHPHDDALADLMVDILSLARSYLSYVGERRLALVLAERAMVIADTVTPRSSAVAARGLAMAHLQNHDFQIAYAIASAAADQLDDSPLLLGSLASVAAKAAARLRDNPRSAALLRQAQQAADQLGAGQSHRGIWFGPADVALTRMTLAWIRGDTDDILLVAQTTPPPPGMPPNLQIPFHAIVASLYARRGDIGTALLQLLKIERLSRDAVVHDRMVHAVLRDLIAARHPVLSPDIQRLARLAALA